VAAKLGAEYHKAYTLDMPLEKVIELFYRGSGVEHLCSYEKFREDEIFVIPADPDKIKIPPGLSEFCKDPENHPLQTPTGKLEFTSTGIQKHFPDDPERPPFPKWFEKGASHDERLGSARAEKYPLLCVSNHPRWRMHAQCDDITWTREVETMKIRAKDGYQYEPVWLNPAEAEKRAISHGDIVKVFNEKGIVLGGAYITERIIPQACYMDHGARFDPIDPNGIDRGGAINLLTPTATTSKNATGMAVSSFLVEVERVSDEEMAEWKARYPDAFARKIDKATGVCLDGWTVNS
jgi:trimethylamine-N-oxide reductase (cytochrome c)